MTGEFETLIKTDIMVLSACLFSAGDHDICAAAGSQNRLLLADIQLSRVVRLLEHKSQITAVVEYKQYIITGDTKVGLRGECDGRERSSSSTTRHTTA